MPHSAPAAARRARCDLSKNLSGCLAPCGKPKWLCLAVARGISREAKAGGEYRARTGDLLDANQALSQLS